MEKNSKKYLVLVHGWLKNQKYWLGILPYFQNIFNVYTLDLPGFGQSPQPKEAWGVEDYANWLEKHLKQKFGDQKIYLLGHSIGGAISLKFASKNPEMVEKLVLYSPKLVPTRNFWTVFSKVFRYPAKLLPKKLRKKFANKILDMAESDFYDSQHLEDIYKEVLKVNLREEAKEIELPTLILGGKSDKQIPESNLVLFNNLIKNSKLQLFENIDHFLHLEDPGVFSSVVKNFLLRTDG